MADTEEKKAKKPDKAPRPEASQQPDKAAKAEKGDKAPKAAKGEKSEKGDKGEKGDAATVNVRAVQADGSVSCQANETLVSVFCPSGGAPDGAKCGTAPTVGLCLRKP